MSNVFNPVPPPERPILMSGPMVRAILDGRKTQTRRVVGGLSKRFPLVRLREDGGFHDSMAWGWKHAEDGVDAPLGGWVEWCPYGVPGDRLWVRETWTGADDPAHKHAVHYRADGERACRWRPSIFMPRWASRLTMELTRVCVERLLTISVEDAFAEGIELKRCPDCHLAAYGLPEWGHDDLQKTPIEAYWHLWDAINEKRGYGRAKNPWVWVIEFKRVK